MSCIHRLNNYGLVSESARGPSSPQTMLATSMKSVITREDLLAGREIDPPLCKYRKGFTDHLKPRAFVMSVSTRVSTFAAMLNIFPYLFGFALLCFTLYSQTLRVVIQQSSLIVANFMSDQLEGELKRNQSVQEGKISQVEADEQAQEWEKVRFFLSCMDTLVFVGGRNDVGSFYHR